MSAQELLQRAGQALCAFSVLCVLCAMRRYLHDDVRSVCSDLSGKVRRQGIERYAQRRSQRTSEACVTAPYIPQAGGKQEMPTILSASPRELATVLAPSWEHDVRGTTKGEDEV